MFSSELTLHNVSGNFATSVKSSSLWALMRRSLSALFRAGSGETKSGSYRGNPRDEIRQRSRSVSIITRDQLNSRFHGRDIFREIGLLP